MLHVHVLQDYVKKINEEANNSIVNSISLSTLQLNNNKREHTLTFPENISDEFKVDTAKKSLYFKYKMRGVNHNFIKCVAFHTLTPTVRTCLLSFLQVF